MMSFVIFFHGIVFKTQCVASTSDSPQLRPSLCMADGGSLGAQYQHNIYIPDLGKKVKENKEQIMHLSKVTGDHEENKAGG